MAAPHGTLIVKNRNGCHWGTNARGGAAKIWKARQPCESQRNWRVWFLTTNWVLAEVLPKALDLLQTAYPVECLRLYLPDALAGEAKLPAHFHQGAAPAVQDPVAQL